MQSLSHVFVSAVVGLKAVTDDKEVDECGCIPVKLYSQNYGVGIVCQRLVLILSFQL